MKPTLHFLLARSDDERIFGVEQSFEALEGDLCAGHGQDGRQGGSVTDEDEVTHEERAQKRA